MWSICMRFQYVINCLYDIHTFRISRLSSFVLLFILVFRYFLDFFFFLINSWENCSFVNFSFFSDVLNVLFFFLYNSTPTLLHKFTTDERGKQPPNVSRSFSVKQEKKKMSFLVNGWIFILFFFLFTTIIKNVCVCVFVFTYRVVLEKSNHKWKWSRKNSEIEKNRKFMDNKQSTHKNS